ncbi:Fc receptor-like protein 5 [Mixophyes fleayi]|uniref:Fc receptor-like protein 5 n=1 Tax=Mixophyes fleayi TaxID=3061075 RepID=UPI003F4DF423
MSTFVLMILGSTTLQVLAIDPNNPEDVGRPVVTFSPDWRKMFYNETLTIACIGITNVRGNQTYIWYRNNDKMTISQQNFTISSIQLYDRATYQCQTSTSARSEFARQHVITDLTILRVPRFVFEGDTLTLKCDSRLDVNTTTAVASFYKDNKLLKAMNPVTYLFIGKVDSNVAGKYRCSKTAIFLNNERNADDEEIISVTELFSAPEIKIIPYPISVGADMTLTCVTILHPLKSGTELYFAFYRNGWHVQGLSLSNQYKVPSVKVEDSGDYACEVRTATNSVWKMSKISPIQVQYAVKPVVIFSPNWNKIFRGQKITLLCDFGSSNQGIQGFSWYRDNNQLNNNRRSFTIYAAGDSDIGNYQCQGEYGEKSDPVHLDVFFVWLILQAPHSIHEGDIVTLSCQHWSSGSVKNTTFYKDDNVMKFLDTLSDLKLGVVSKNTTGKYKCTKFINTGTQSKIYFAEEFILVAELFSPPEIRVYPHIIVEGADMTLTCYTTLSPLRRSTVLQFAFYKNGQKLQEFSSSDAYRVPSAQLEHSGNYTCEVKTSSGNVWKMSKALPINIQGMAVVSFTPNVGKIITNESISLTCTVDSKIIGPQTYYWYKDNNKINITQKSFTIPAGAVEDSGYYQCQSSNTHISDHVRLDVSNSDLILQAPPIIYEGDTVTLGCHHRPGLNLYRVEFYKDGNFMKIVDTGSDLQMGTAYRNMTRKYGCTKRNDISTFKFNSYIADAFVSVTELFTYLQLKASASPVTEGDYITLSCDTALSPSLYLLRGNTELQFAFYNNGQIVKEFSTSNKYNIISAKKNDSGNYTCEVKNKANSVTKMSQALDINVQELFTTPQLSVNPYAIAAGDAFIVTCDATLIPNRQTISLAYSFYQNGKLRKSLKTVSKYRVFAAQPDDSGDYTCQVSASPTNIIKTSNGSYVLVQQRMSSIRMTADKEDHEILAGNNLTFTCSIQYGTSPTFTWLHNSKVVDVNCVLYQIMHNGRVLFIDSLQQHHSGDYECQVSNQFSTEKSASLKISVIEPIDGVRISTERKTLDLEPGDTLTFTCSVARGIASTFLWLHNEEKVDKDNGMYDVRDSGKVLYIKSTHAYHGGTYQCKAIKNVSLRRNMILQSEILTVGISDKSHPYLVPTLVVIALLAIILISAIVYKFRNKLVPSFIYTHSQQIRVSANHDEDSLLVMDSLETFDGFSNSHH